MRFAKKETVDHIFQFDGLHFQSDVGSLHFRLSYISDIVHYIVTWTWKNIE